MQVSFTYLALAALFGYVAAALFLWVAQGRIIFGKPTRLRPLLPGPIESQHTVQPIRLAVTSMVQLEGWASRPMEAQQRKVLIYFGGRNMPPAVRPSMLGSPVLRTLPPTSSRCVSACAS